ncbi:MAG: hypothetical protein IM600_15210 [Bacteroidetes bacterium]|nr:hypothetical protein [Bacteroidota bacterium]MCA6444778.1 hypothetical protein [Bacteroidota bacterium]
MFQGRQLLIVSKHQKESVLKPLFEKMLQVTVIATANFDTDRFGTFSGEIEREGDALTTLRKKCSEAMAEYNADLAVASEGSFGPHPSIPFLTADDELLILIDKRNELEITAREISTETNFNGKEIKTIDELIDFANHVGFPSHGIILKSHANHKEAPIKDCKNIDELIFAAKKYIRNEGMCFAETDMRAMNNPTRMKVIEKAGKKLVKKLQSNCPSCGTPGYDVIKVNPGLPCGQCGFPTRSTLSQIFGCLKCDNIQTKFYPNSKEIEDPMYCDYCNP